MMRSLYAGVAGLKTHQSKMDVLGNNIANVNTTSYKSQSITFSDLMYQTTQTASSATLTKGGINARQVGLGAKSGAIQTAIEAQGATQTTNNPFDLMITGKAFFVVNNGAEQMYTRDGSFYIDGAGNLAMQSNGYLVQGWVAQEDKETGEIKVNRNGGLTGLQIMSAENTTYSPAATTSGLFSGNIDDNDTNITSDDGRTVTLEFYDNKGYLYTGKFILKDTGTEHLFALQLKDVLDSNGNSIGKARMEGISFGSTEDTAAYIQSGYDVRVGASTSEVIELEGAIKFEAVPPTGTLSDLMTSSKADYAGVLAEVFGITDEDVTGNATPYNKLSTYSIEDDGTFTIFYTKNDAEVKSKDNGYVMLQNEGAKYYVKNDGTDLAYQVPTKSTGSLTTPNESLNATLINVFGMTANEIATYSTSQYSYEFSSNPNGRDKFQIFDISDPEHKVIKFERDALEGYDGAPFTQKETVIQFRNVGTQDKPGDYSYYVMTAKPSIVRDMNKTVLEKVFGLTKDVSPAKNGYDVNLGNGILKISHTEQEHPEIDEDYKADVRYDGTINFVTANDKRIIDDLPNSGDIINLMETAEGKYAGILKKVYGVTDADADAFGTDGTYSLNSDGSITLTTGEQTIQLKFDPANGSLTTANGRSDGMVNLVFNQRFEGLEPFGYQKLPTDDNDVITGRLTLDFSTVTNYNTSGSATIKAVKGDKKSLNTGRAVGELNGVSVATDGQIYASYSNGQTKLLGQIATAEFANASGLSKEGDNLYSSTLNSGDPTIQDITTDGGYMSTGVLEMSNVDLSKEFTEMITTQRGFQANSRIITVSDTLLEELTNLKR